MTAGGEAGLGVSNVPLWLIPIFLLSFVLIFGVAVLIEADRLVRRTGDPASLRHLAELVRAILGSRGSR
jgi:hypothetical protein